LEKSIFGYNGRLFGSYLTIYRNSEFLSGS
jgi:hypothetical protein